MHFLEEKYPQLKFTVEPSKYLKKKNILQNVVFYTSLENNQCVDYGNYLKKYIYF